MSFKKYIFLEVFFCNLSLFPLAARDVITWYVSFVPQTLKSMRSSHCASYTAGKISFQKHAFWQILEVLNLHFYFEVHKMGSQVAHGDYCKNHVPQKNGDSTVLDDVKISVNTVALSGQAALDSSRKDLMIENINR